MQLLQAVSAQDFSGVGRLVEQRKNQFGGKLAIMVWRDTILYQKTTGDLTINSQGNIGCASAWLTAALAMTFVEQGKISLDDNIAEYLPVYAKYAKSYLTIRHCLANTTGLEREKGGMEKFFQKNKFASLEDQVNAFASSREIVNNPGEAFSYNNIGTNIVGRVLEVVGKKSFDRLAMERIFRPLGMKKSSFASELAIDPFAGAQSTPSDLTKFMAMLVNKGSLNGKKILSEVSIVEMQKLQTGEAKIIFVPRQAEGWTYGLGNWIQGEGIYGNPSLSGGWQYIDTRKKYSCIVFGQQKDKEDKKNVYMEIAEAVNHLMQ